jgi:hypothetical protein
LGFNAQENTFQKKGNVKSDQEIYAEGRAEYSKVLIIPFEPKMYISSADKEIASRTKLTHQEIRENMRYGISNQMRHAVGKGMKSVSLLHIDTGAVGRDLGYIYNSIGYKYKPLPEDDIARNKQNEEDLKPVNKLKGSLNKLIKHDNLAPKESNGETRIKNGQIHSTVSYGEKFMNTSIHNPSLLKVLSAKYQADVFLFINELNIEAAAPASRSGLSALSYKRKVKVHYTIFNKDGKELHGGAAIVYMPSTTNDMNKIINNYFPILAQNMSDNIPGAQTSKLDQQKLKEEERKAAEQREQIKKL